MTRLMTPFRVSGTDKKANSEELQRPPERVIGTHKIRAA